MTGFLPGVVDAGTTHSGDAVALQAQVDVTTAYDMAMMLAQTSDETDTDLRG